jgi:hypothetical protein
LAVKQIVDGVIINKHDVPVRCTHGVSGGLGKIILQLTTLALRHRRLSKKHCELLALENGFALFEKGRYTLVVVIGLACSSLQFLL